MVDGIGNGSLARIARDALALKARSEQLSRQAASGARGELYGDIAPEARRSIDLRAEIGRRETHEASIGRALGRAETAQVALGRITDIARRFMGEALRLTEGDPTRIQTVAVAAREALGEFGVLLNERHAGEYLFAGSDVGNPPVVDGAGLGNGAMASAIRTQVAALAPGNAALVAAGTAAEATNPALTPFSAHLEIGPGATEPRRVAVIGDGEQAGYGLFASRNADATSSGETVGAWSRDIIRGLAILSGLTAGSAAAGADFRAIVDVARGALASAGEALAEEAGVLGLAEERMAAARTRHGDVTLALQKSRAAIEDADLAETIAQLQDTRTRLEASYRAVGVVSGLSLAQFLR
jgi:flagellin-like hook-associated protein FlgL